MNGTISIIFPILFPVLAGAILLFLPVKDLKKMVIYMITVLVVNGAAVLFLLGKNEVSLQAFSLVEDIAIYFHIDSVSKLFAGLITVVWILVGIYTTKYIEHMEHKKRFIGFYIIVFGVLFGLYFAGNLVTMYIFYELITVSSFPLVLHNQDRKAIMAGLKYLFYSFAGAFISLIGIFIVFYYEKDLTFVAGGFLQNHTRTGLLMLAAMLMIIGFGAKAGMFPLHAWLPTAHPEAPAPASAVLSGIITKSGVFAIVRVVFFVFGANFLRDTWVQTVFMTLTLITVLMGSMMAYKENVFKKRLAYSTVSQVSYILFGIAVMTENGLVGALLHIIFHSFIKNALFLVAGAIIFKYGLEKVDQLEAIGKKMPLTIGCYLIISLGLTGIPPTTGFTSKWYLAIGALDSGVKGFSVIGPSVLLISALLTAGYLLPIAMKGFYPGEQAMKVEKNDASYIMIIPIAIFTLATVLLGIFPNTLIIFMQSIATAVM